MKTVYKFISLALAFTMLIALSSCKKDDTESKTAGISAKEVLTAVTDENMDGKAFFKEDIFKDNCQKLYGIEYSELQDGGIIYNSAGGLADEISIIRLKSDASHDPLDVLNSRKEMRIRDFTGYSPDEVSKIENAVVFEASGFAVLIISDNADDLQEKVTSAIKKG